VKIKIGESEYRIHEEYPEPFALYPGESLVKTDAIPVVPRNSSIKLEAIRDFVDAKGKKRVSGDEWIEYGPLLYTPRVEVNVLAIQTPHIIASNQALRIKAKRDTKDHLGKQREAGEEWLIRERGPYVCGIDEEYIHFVDGTIIDLNSALLL